MLSIQYHRCPSPLLHPHPSRRSPRYQQGASSSGVPLATTNTPSAPKNQLEESRSTHIGAIAGGVAGAVALLGLVLTSCILLYRRSKDRTPKPRTVIFDESPPQTSQTHSDESRYYSAQTIHHVQPKRSIHELESQHGLRSGLPASQKHHELANNTTPAGLSPPLSLPPSYRSGPPSPPQAFDRSSDSSQQPSAWSPSQLNSQPLAGFSNVQSPLLPASNQQYLVGGYVSHD